MGRLRARWQSPCPLSVQSDRATPCRPVALFRKVLRHRSSLIDLGRTSSGFRWPGIEPRLQPVTEAAKRPGPNRRSRLFSTFSRPLSHSTQATYLRVPRPRPRVLLTSHGNKEGGRFPAVLGSRRVRNDSSGLVAVTPLSSTNRARFSGTIGPNQQLTDTPRTSRSQRANRSPLITRTGGALRRPCLGFRGFRSDVAGQPDAAGFMGRLRSVVRRGVTEQALAGSPRGAGLRAADARNSP